MLGCLCYFCWRQHFSRPPFKTRRSHWNDINFFWV